jgi:Holliday junction resolvase RusA-like endonuclease
MATQPSRLLCDFWVAGHPVSVNAAYGHRRAQAGAYLTRAARDWRTAVATEAMLHRQAITAEARFHITSIYPRYRTQTLHVACEVIGVRGDVDNYLKLALDGLKQGLQIDDRYISVAHVTRVKRTPHTPQGMTQGMRFTVWLANLSDSQPAITPPSTDVMTSPVSTETTDSTTSTAAATDRTPSCNTAATPTTQAATRRRRSSRPTTAPDAASAPRRRRSLTG